MQLSVLQLVTLLFDFQSVLRTTRVDIHILNKKEQFPSRSIHSLLFFQQLLHNTLVDCSHMQKQLRRQP